MSLQPFSFLQLTPSTLPLHIIGTLEQPVYAQLMNVQDSICVCQIILPVSFHTIPNTQIVLIPINKVHPIQFKDLPKEYQDSVNKTKAILHEYYQMPVEKPGSSLVPLNNYVHDDKDAMLIKKKNLDEGKKDLYSYYLFNALLNTNPHLQWHEESMVIGQVAIAPPFTSAISKKENDSSVDRIQAMLDKAHIHAKSMMEQHAEYSTKKQSSTTWAGLVKQSSPTVTHHQPVEDSPESVNDPDESVDDKKKKYKKKFSNKRYDERPESRGSDRGGEYRRGRGRGRGTRSFSKKAAE